MFFFLVYSIVLHFLTGFLVHFFFGSFKHFIKFLIFFLVVTRGGVRPTTKAFVIFKASALWADAFYKSPVNLSICVCVGLFTFEVLFKCFFASTSQNWMSITVKDLESLGEK